VGIDIIAGQPVAQEEQIPNGFGDGMNDVDLLWIDNA